MDSANMVTQTNVNHLTYGTYVSRPNVLIFGMTGHQQDKVQNHVRHPPEKFGTHCGNRQVNKREHVEPLDIRTQIGYKKKLVITDGQAFLTRLVTI